MTEGGKRTQDRYRQNLLTLRVANVALIIETCLVPLRRFVAVESCHDSEPVAAAD